MVFISIRVFFCTLVVQVVWLIKSDVVKKKKGLLRTMLDRAHRLSSSWTHVSDECDRLKTVFSRLKYSKHPVISTIKSFVDSKICDQQRPLSPRQEREDTIRLVVPFKDQISADIVKKQLKDLSPKVHTTIQSVFVSRKIEQELNVKKQRHQLLKGLGR